MILHIDGVGADLEGVGSDEAGRRVFVPFALPGEVVEIQPDRETGRFARARLLRVLSPSPERALPPCPLYGRCGGCQAQHMRYQHSLDLKQRVVADALRRIGGFDRPEVRGTLGMKDPWRYRNKAEYAVAAGPNGRAAVGMREPRSHRVLDLDDCPLQHPSNALAIAALRAHIKEHPAEIPTQLVTRVNAAGRLMAIVGGSPAPRGLAALADRMFHEVPGMASLYACDYGRRPAHALDGATRLVRGDATIAESIAGLSFELSPKSFFQVNRSQAEALYALAVDAAAPAGNETAVDAYTGIGAIALMLARRAGRTIGVELSPDAVRDARAAARRNNLSDRAQFIEADAPKALSEMAAAGQKIDALVVDPPRKGLDRALIDAALKMRPARIALVSCNPATLARDARALAEGGVYQLNWAQPVDMFCWTGHVETVVLMSRV